MHGASRNNPQSCLYASRFSTSALLTFCAWLLCGCLGNCGIFLSTSNLHQLRCSPWDLREPCFFWGTNSSLLEILLLFISRETQELPAHLNQFGTLFHSWSWADKTFVLQAKGWKMFESSLSDWNIRRTWRGSSGEVGRKQFQRHHFSPSTVQVLAQD